RQRRRRAQNRFHFIDERVCLLQTGIRKNETRNRRSGRGIWRGHCPAGVGVWEQLGALMQKTPVLPIIGGNRLIYFCHVEDAAKVVASLCRGPAPSGVVTLAC